MTHSELKNMANRIKKRRKDYGFTQEQFAEKICITYGSYTKIENAFQKPALDTLIKISEQLDVSLDYLVFGAEERKPKEITDTDVLDYLLKNLDSEKLLYASEILVKMAKIKSK